MGRTAALRAVLAEAGFRRLYATRLVSAVADGSFQAALASYVLFNPERATTPAEAAAALTALALPYSLIGPFVGVFLDRWRRQRVLVIGNTVKAALVVGVAALVADRAENGAFLAVTIAALSVNRLFLAALSAALPHVVPENYLVTANAVATTSGTVATIIGAGIGGSLRLAAGTHALALGGVVAAAALGYLGSALVARRFAADELGPDVPLAVPMWHAVHAVLAGLAAAARHVAQRQRVASALAAISAHRFCYGMATLTIVLLERNYFAHENQAVRGLFGLGAVVGASGLGIVAAALVTPRVTRRIGTTRWVAAMLCAAGTAVAVFGLPFQRELLIAGAFVLGFSAQGMKICVDTIVQADVADNFRGRVFSGYDMLYNVTYVAAAAAAAAALPPSGKSDAVMSGLAAGYVLAGLSFAWFTRGAVVRERPMVGRQPERVAAQPPGNFQDAR
ncbi:major facilitator superfamily MFS_1 [Acidothermus cellulolyticus 11B]|uniref:Major facilitator superfamily MFS_1 n=1 Tax=Acidothermus cellulolyticus (strain ATCC 43068 / DSM 8971 / 11B) TaxID=351607 RepID=A0LVC2_ACIC1|nr:MFS transporter [Acidothermus cellulolyticus]ABK53382.1 major facilitator superfamily MFS_1 [Acidothermus cellulolyticus 11B]